MSYFCFLILGFYNYCMRVWKINASTDKRKGAKTDPARVTGVISWKNLLTSSSWFYRRFLITLELIVQTFCKWWWWWWFIFMVWLTGERRLALFPAGTIVRDPLANLQHVASRIWTSAEPEFKLCWMKLCSSDNHYTTGPPLG